MRAGRGLTSIGAAHLQRAVGDAEPRRRLLQVSVFIADRDAHGHIGGAVAYVS